jgi:hypothetical protein
VGGGLMLKESSPYVVTVVIGILAWLFTHISDSLLNTPMIEYSRSISSRNTDKFIAIVITNVTRTITFNSLTIRVTTPEASKVTRMQIIPIEPAYEGDVQPTIKDHLAEFAFGKIHPGFSYNIRVSYEGSSEPNIRFIADDTIYFTKGNIQTFIVRHQVGLLMFLFIIWIVVLLSVYVKINNDKV